MSEEVHFKAGQAPGYQASPVEGVQVTEKWKQFIQMAVDGKLPDPGKVPELDPNVRALAEDLVVIHLPEWRNPAGRVMAEPATVHTQNAIRIAQYFHDRGYRFVPGCETVRWRATPGGPPGAYDQGLHIRPDEDGNWPDPDPEDFYDFDDIKVGPLEDGRWAATHPRGLQFEADTKSEAYEGIVARLRAKIEEAKNVLDG
ncbi:hypothetical protein IU448_15275 [Nocardia flavorosea]|uniref:hypothetical protein n=1 Tax=Nocardia flavorosea TaxID=53429 RepID=UPI0018955670|nr:hypothetical protein [Nocardia flavorosea]MBF6350368.1 hypothetical protein [Nocardia flavorosea]